MLVDPDNRRIKHLDTSFAGISHGVQDAIPDASLSPSIEAVVAGRVGAEVPRQITPRCTGTQDPEDAIQDPPIINPRHTTGFVRKHGLNGVPFAVCESIPHD
jgi:hypothetical protein